MDDQSQPEKLPTVPTTYTVSVRGIDGSEDDLRKFGNLLGLYTKELSRVIDLKSLDGMTVAGDYKQALLELDRGMETTLALTPSEDFGIGVAMTPLVKRDGQVKSHIVFNAFMLALFDEKHEHFQTAIQVLAHECAHVEISNRFDQAFPGVLMQKKYDDWHEAIRGRIYMGCWDEYAATWISAPYGSDPTCGYEDTFITALEETRPKANELIKKYRLHGNHGQIMDEVYEVYGKLMKYACYHLGNMDGRNLLIENMPKTKIALEDHWFAPYFERLQDACRSIGEQYGKWTDYAPFEKIADIADEVVREGGVTVSRRDGQLWADIPFTVETLPSERV
jgi:hypothetical protein